MKNIHVLQTDKKTRLFTSDSVLILAGYPATTFKTGKNIFITSDEEIKEGDLCINLAHKVIVRPTDAEWANSNHNNLKKIILTTDQDLIRDGIQSIDDEFLEWFVKNPSCEEVEVVVEKYNEDEWVDDDFGGETYTFEYEKYKIILPKKETKLKNICIKCGVDLYATEGRFECQKHPKECKGIYLSEETLLIHAAEKKQQHLIDMMKGDEELGLYKEPKFVTVNMESATGEDLGRVSYIPIPNVDYTLKKPQKMEINAEVAEYLGFTKGVEWQMERSYTEKEVLDLLKKFYQDDNNFNGTIEEWFEQYKKK